MHGIDDVMGWPLGRVIAAASEETRIRREAICEAAIAARAGGADAKSWQRFVDDLTA